MEWDIMAYDKMLTYQVKINQEVEIPLIRNEYLLQANTILDIGCGNGCFTATLADQYPDKHFIALDSNTELISFAQKYHLRKNITYINTEYKNFESDVKFDIAIARLVVHIIPNRIHFFNWIYSNIRSGGAFFVIDADDDNFCVYPKLPIFCSLDNRTNQKINSVGTRDTKLIIKKELMSCGFRENRFFTFSPNSITVSKAVFYKYMMYVMEIEKGEELPLAAYKELFDWYDNDNSFIQYGLYFGLFLKEGKKYED